MDKRQKDIKNMALQAGLTPVRFDRRNSRNYLLCLAENGAEREFSVSLGTRSDARGDLNELGSMKRFARENKLPEDSAAPTTNPINTTESSLTMSKAAAAPMKIAAPATARQLAAPDALAPVTFYRVCEWLKTQKLANFPTLEALALQAAQHVDTPVSEEDMQLVMSAIGTKEPAHWTEPTDPHAIIVRELSSFMKKLGEPPTPAFERLAARLLP